MGMYTEFHFNAELSIEKDSEKASLLKAMIDGTEPEYIPTHPLFNCERWRWMLRMDSYYFPSDTHSTLRWDDIGNSYYLCIRCNLKNYDLEIEYFIDWIHHMLSCEEGEFLGFYRYEENDSPTLLWYRTSGIYARAVPESWALEEAEKEESA